MHDPLAPHSHEPNPDPPAADPGFVLSAPGGHERVFTPEDLRALPASTVTDCYVVSTGHGTSGPFAFTGALLKDFLAAHLHPDQRWSQVEVIGGDGFGCRVRAAELGQPGRQGRILLAYAIDGQAMSRQQGLVRLIVPGETDDALRQVKWIGRMDVIGDP